MLYRTEIDGLRALAVIPVIFFHAGFQVFSGGFVGVDVFFVISGYLITSILINEISEDDFSVIRFYERRARRILPALVVVTILIFILAWIVMNPIDLRKAGGALLGVAAFGSNIFFWRSQGYFDESAEMNPLVHTWSLAVEEQYYIIFPIILLVAWRLGRTPVLWLVIITAVFSLLISEWGWRNNPTANFYLTPTRAWELLIGSLAAFVVTNKGVQSNNLFSTLGLFLIVFSILFYDETTPFPSIYTLVPVIGVYLIILYGGEKTYTARLLSLKIFVGVGLISYSLYLWHQPLFAYSRLLMKDVDLPFYMSLGLILICFLLAFLSWKYIESPFRDRDFVSRKTVFSLSAFFLSLIAGMGWLSIKATEDFEDHLAKQLSQSEYVYFSNLDERKFIEARLFYPLNDVDTLVMGSSRVMQIGTQDLAESVMNLSVSGASVEDDIAFIGEAVTKLNPKRVMISADPWLFNRYNGQNRWKSVARLFEHWQEEIYVGSSESSELLLSQRRLENTTNNAQELYSSINIYGALTSSHGRVEAIAKKAYDGYHIYGQSYESATQDSIVNGFNGIINYSMRRYEHNSDALDKFIHLIQWLKRKEIDVSLVLSPYHPLLFERIEKEKPVFIAIESDYRALADELKINVLGSYDAKRLGCHADEFYDGMHPRSSCMKKVLASKI